MPTVTMKEAQATLPELIKTIAPGQSLIITDQEKPVAKLTALLFQEGKPVFGRCKGMLTIVTDDDEHLEHFKDYAP